MANNVAKFLIFFTPQLQESLMASFAWKREKNKKRERERERERTLELVLRYVTAYLVSLFPASPILALLVGRGVTTLAPSSSNNTSNKKKFNNSKLKKIYHFQH
jgi:hypothetical protein